MDTKRKRKRERQTFTPEFKAEVVELCRQGDRTIGAVARHLGLTETSIRKCRPGGHRCWSARWTYTAEREEIARLRKQVRILTEERDILKRATAFFAKETR